MISKIDSIGIDGQTALAIFSIVILECLRIMIFREEGLPIKWASHPSDGKSL